MSAFTKLMIHGTHRHVELQAHANLGLSEIKPWGTGERWKEEDGDRFEAELERIASDPKLVEAAVERFDDEVTQRAMAQSEERYSGVPLNTIVERIREERIKSANGKEV
jgi:hypothetical protein